LAKIYLFVDMLWDMFRLNIKVDILRIDSNMSLIILFILIHSTSVYSHLYFI